MTEHHVQVRASFQVSAIGRRRLPAGGPSRNKREGAIRTGYQLDSINTDNGLAKTGKLIAEKLTTDY
jgi:hypothetical protein